MAARWAVGSVCWYVSRVMLDFAWPIVVETVLRGVPASASRVEKACRNPWIVPFTFAFERIGSRYLVRT